MTARKLMAVTDEERAQIVKQRETKESVDRLLKRFAAAEDKRKTSPIPAGHYRCKHCYLSAGFDSDCVCLTCRFY